ncbi:MAG: hypothetical protein ABEJ96_01900, partial [Thiohalorhabdaceae bacterium]
MDVGIYGVIAFYGGPLLIGAMFSRSSSDLPMFMAVVMYVTLLGLGYAGYHALKTLGKENVVGDF